MMPPPAPAATLTIWPPARRALAVAAVACAAATSAAGAVLSEDPTATFVAFVHLLCAAWALGDSRLVAAQVAAGVVLTWLMVPGTDGTVVAVAPVVASVVATSELLGVTARLRMVVPRHPGPEVQRVGLAVAMALATSGATLGAAALPGPSGLVATAVAAVGCLVLATAVRVSGAGPDPQPTTSAQR